MLKSICKNVAWLAVPLSLALGCAANRTSTTAEASGSYSSTPVLAPTSGEPEQRIYSTDPTANAAPSDINAPPPGANATDWGVAESIREKLTADPTLAPLGSKLIAEVGKDGEVTLKGVVKTPDEKQRVRDTISGVSAVKGVNDDQLEVGHSFKEGGRLDTMQPQ